MSSVVETVTDLVTPILDEQNFELVEVEFVKEGK
ncbi:ribosome maturation factor RimP, partial [Enterococcus sp. S181_ASV_20]|nr:ribosome maturation factor RimP [Enterococcus sp. S181_ASV_20]